MGIRWNRLLYCLTLAAIQIGAFQDCSLTQSFESDSVSSASHCAQNVHCKVFHVPTVAGESFYSEFNRTLVDAESWTAQSELNTAYLLFPKKASFALPRQLDSWSSLNIHDSRRITVDGNGSQITNPPSSTFLSVSNCKFCRVKNFEVLATPGIYSQGLVTAFNGLELTLRIDEGFPMASFAQGQIVSSETVGVGKAIFMGVMFQLENESWSFNKKQLSGAVRPHLGLDWIEVVDSDNRLLKIHLLATDEHGLKSPSYEKAIKAFETAFNQGTKLKFAYMLPNMELEKRMALAGASFDLVGDPSGYITLNRNLDFTLDNIFVHFSPTRALLTDSNQGTLTINNLHIGGANAEQLLYNMNGAFIFRDDESGAQINGARIEGSLDDMIVATSLPILLLDESTNNLEKSYLVGSQNKIKSGDNLGYFEPITGRLVSEGLIVTNTQAVAKNRTWIQFSKPLPGGLTSVANSVDGRFATRFYNLSRAPIGMKISNITLERGARNGIICAGSCTVTNSQFENLALRAFGVLNREVKNGSQPAGPLPGAGGPIIFRNNKVSHIGSIGLDISMLSASSSTPILNPVYIFENNTFSDIGEKVFNEAGYQRSQNCSACIFAP